MASLVAGLDFGTSGAKLLLLAPDGTVVARRQAEYPTRVDASGGVEQDPEDWWRAAVSLLSGCESAAQIVAIGLTGQMQDLVAVARRRALRPAMLYSDLRTGAQHRRLRGVVPEWEARTGNHQDATNVAAKIAWLAEHEPECVREADHLLFGAAGYVAHRAGAEPGCDVTTASTTGLLDVRARTWLDVAVTAAGADPALLPRLVDGSRDDTIVGTVDEASSRELGVRAGTPLVLAMGDAGSTTDGLIGRDPGDGYLSLGSTGWIAAVADARDEEPSPIHSLVLPEWRTRLRIGSVQSAGAAAAWARRAFLPDLGIDEIDRVAATRLHALDDRPLCLPGLSGERAPVRDADFRAAFVGATATTGPLDLYLAALTGVAMGLRHAADDSGTRQARLPAVGGGATSPVWRQILADVFDATILTGVADEPGCHSAARDAAAAIGLVHELLPLFDAASTADVTETHPSASTGRYAELLAPHRALYDALAPTFHAVADTGDTSGSSDSAGSAAGPTTAS